MQHPLHDANVQFFLTHPDRKARIRPAKTGEAMQEFASLGPHNPARRLMILMRPTDGPARGMLMWIPFLAAADEMIEDRDDILLPIIKE